MKFISLPINARTVITSVVTFYVQRSSFTENIKRLHKSKDLKDKDQIAAKLCHKNEELSISFLWFFFPISPLISLIL